MAIRKSKLGKETAKRSNSSSPKFPILHSTERRACSVCRLPRASTITFKTVFVEMPEPVPAFGAPEEAPHEHYHRTSRDPPAEPQRCQDPGAGRARRGAGILRLYHLCVLCRGDRPA